MARDILLDVAFEKSTFVVTVAFKDDAGVAEDVTLAWWTLTDGDGNVINSRNRVSIPSPGTTEVIVLSGDDLAMQGTGDRELRILTVEATFDTQSLTDLPMKQEIRFWLRNLVGIS